MIVWSSCGQATRRHVVAKPHGHRAVLAPRVAPWLNRTVTVRTRVLLPCGLATTYRSIAKPHDNRANESTIFSITVVLCGCHFSNYVSNSTISEEKKNFFWSVAEKGRCRTWCKVLYLVPSFWLACHWLTTIIWPDLSRNFGMVYIFCTNLWYFFFVRGCERLTNMMWNKFSRYIILYYIRIYR